MRMLVPEMLRHEAAPSNCYAAETLAHSLRWRRAVILGDAIQVAFGHAERLQTRPGRAECDAHAQDVQEFAAAARKCLEADGAWQPSGMFLRWLWGRGVQWAEVEALLCSARRAA